MTSHSDYRRHEIHLAHAQCKLIARALNNLPTAHMTPDDRNELELLARMFADLPSINDVAYTTYLFYA